VRTATDTFRVQVTNSAPALAHVADQTIAYPQGTVALTATDPDGDPLTYSAGVLPVDPLAQQAYDFNQQMRLRYWPNIDNLHGAQEKWLQAANGELYALMPNGDVRHWVGVIAASPVVARFSALYYANPALLCNAQSPATMLRGSDMTLTFQGNQLVIEPRAGVTGTCGVQVGVSDGVQTITETFLVRVTSAAPAAGSLGLETRRDGGASVATDAEQVLRTTETGDLVEVRSLRSGPSRAAAWRALLADQVLTRLDATRASLLEIDAALAADLSNSLAARSAFDTMHPRGKTRLGLLYGELDFAAAESGMES
jgi:hypothetical protein